MIAIAQAVILEGPACATVHRDLAQQDPVTIKLHNLTVIRCAVQRSVDQRRAVIRRHRAAKGAQTLTFVIGIAHHGSHGGWRRGIHRHHLR